MNKLVDFLVELTKDNQYICQYVDKSIDYIKANKIDEIKNSNTELINFLFNSDSKQNMFKSMMESFNYTTINDIPLPENLSLEDFTVLKQNFADSVTLSSKKVSLYQQLLSTELNVINKIKDVGSFNRVDFKV